MLGKFFGRGGEGIGFSRDPPSACRSRAENGRRCPPANNVSLFDWTACFFIPTWAFAAVARSGCQGWPQATAERRVASLTGASTAAGSVTEGVESIVQLMAERSLGRVYWWTPRYARCWWCSRRRDGELVGKPTLRPWLGWWIGRAQSMLRLAIRAREVISAPVSPFGLQD